MELDPQYKGRVGSFEAEEMKKEGARVDSDIKSLTETPDELCLKAEAFVMQANSLKKNCQGANAKVS